jgi:PPIC-type PPIASE domain
LEEGKMSIRVNRTRILVSAGVIGFAITLTLWGRRGSVATATQPPAFSEQAPTVAKEASDYSKRVVAYVYDTIPLTREDFGEYLIARCGAGDRLNNMVNRFIIEHEAKQRGVEVTAAEVEAEFNETLKGINTNKKDFVNTVLKPYHKTLYEWKEDVIKPRLMLVKMCRQRVKVTDEDLANAYEAYYGPKVHCKMIIWPSTERNIAFAAYPKIRDNEKEFDEVAKHQASAELAAKAGEIAPFGRFNTGNVEIEKAAFGLKAGEISQILETQQGFVVLKCLEQIPATHEKTLDEVRAVLTEDVIKRKINQKEIPAFFAELREKAHPKIFTNEGAPTEDLMSEVRRDLQTPPTGGSH